MFFRKKTIKINIRNLNTVIEAKSGTNLYQFLQDEKFVTPTLCNGSGQCGKCKVRFVGTNIPKATSKEELILAKISLDSGYRLACRHNIKNDIEIDISEMSCVKPSLQAEVEPQIEETQATLTAEEMAEVINIATEEREEVAVNAPELDDSLNIDNTLDVPKVDETVSISEFQPMQKVSMLDSHETEGSSDGIFMVQLKDSVRHFCYAAALDNIVSEGITHTEESLIEVIDSNLVPDFVHGVLKIKDIDRVLILIPYNKAYDAKSYYEIVRYFKFEVGQLLCEVIMPYEQNKDIVRFFRLLTVEKQNRLIISLDMLDRVYMYNENVLVDMRNTALEEYSLMNIKPRGSNNILEVSDKLTVSKVEKPGVSPDGITLTALFQVVKMLISKGMVDSQYKLKSRAELIRENVDLSLTINLIGREQPEGIFLYRDRFTEVALTQKELDNLYQIRSFIRSVTQFTKERIGDVDGLAFYTSSNQENIINSMVDLGFVTKEYASKVSYYPGEPTVHAIKLFKEKNFETYMKNHMDNGSVINLAEESRFKDKAKANNLIIE